LEGSSDTGPTSVPAALRREVLMTLGEAAWRQRSWSDVIRAYKGLIEDPGAEAPRLGTFRYRLAVACDRGGDAILAVSTLKPLVEDSELALGVTPELRGQALRLYADLAERANDLPGAARALESFSSLSVETSASARADAMYRAGELFRRAELPEDAIRCLEAALRLSDSHLPALDALEAAWRERGDLERVAVILGRKVAATARHPARQKPLLSRLGDLQAKLQRPDVALATHQRALEIDPTWRPSLRFVTLQLRESGQGVAAAGGLAQLTGDLSGDSGVDLANVLRDRQNAAVALGELVMSLDDQQVQSVRDVALPALERAAVDATRMRGDAKNAGEPTNASASVNVAAPIARLRGEAPEPAVPRDEEHTPSARVSQPHMAALSLRDAATRSRASGKLDEAFASLETANHVNPGDTLLLRELVELATQLEDHDAAAKHLAELATLLTGTQRANTLLELADIYFDELENPAKGRDAMRSAADAFGTGVRRDSTLRLLATEAASNLAWDAAVDALSAVPEPKRTVADITSLANALVRAGRQGDAERLIEAATESGRFDDDGALADQLRAETERKAWLARTLDARAGNATSPADAADLRAEANDIRDEIGEFETTPPPRTKTNRGVGTSDKTPASTPQPNPTEPPGEATMRVHVVPPAHARSSTQPPPLAGRRPAKTPAPIASEPPLASEHPT
nr:hypothetical protein [Deltaproteobacteria bacterium]